MNEGCPSMRRSPGARPTVGTLRVRRWGGRAAWVESTKLRSSGNTMSLRIRILLTVALMLPWATPAAAYSLLTHEQLIDLTWQDSIVPLLLSRYPNLTHDQLDQARAYAYGGFVV